MRFKATSVCLEVIFFLVVSFESLKPPHPLYCPHLQLAISHFPILSWNPSPFSGRLLKLVPTFRSNLKVTSTIKTCPTPFSATPLCLCDYNLGSGRRGRDRMVVGFTITYAISAYHHWCCELESRSGRGVQHYLIKFVSDLPQVLSGSSGFLHQ